MSLSPDHPQSRDAASDPAPAQQGAPDSAPGEHLGAGPEEGALPQKRGSGPLRGAEQRLRRLLRESPLPPEAREQAEAELERWAELDRGSDAAAAIARRLEWMAELPWRPAPARPLPDIARARAMLDATHVGAENAKQRVLEMLAVQASSGRPAAGHLCLAGPPGVGKTSFARSLAHVLGRPAVWLPAGAVTEEYELFGAPHHSGDGAPGAVLEGLRRVGCCDPVLILDELDALELGGAGDSISPLLPLFDAELSVEFTDRYLGLPFDLSRCLIVATAEDPDDLAEALSSRLEVVELSSYSFAEKSELASGRLLPDARRAAGLAEHELQLTQRALERLIADYTEEAGVRQLRRRIERLVRFAALARAQGRGPLRVRRRDLQGLLGAPRMDDDTWRPRDRVGVVLGLSWTSAGGAPLPIEVACTPGAGRSVVTGQLGEVMRESVQCATTWLRTRLERLGRSSDALESLDLHVHCPAAAIPKDGPSAGLAIAVALASRIANRPLRPDVALTGEITLLGQVLAVGGLREKLLAAERAGVRRVIVPRPNAAEALELRGRLGPALELCPVETVEEALELALLPGRGRRGE